MHPSGPHAEPTARISPLYLHVVAQVIQARLRGDPAQPPRELQALLELLKESLLELGASVSDAEARGYLEKIETGGKTVRLVRELLALEEKPEPSIGRQALLRNRRGGCEDRTMVDLRWLAPTACDCSLCRKRV